MGTGEWEEVDEVARRPRALLANTQKARIARHDALYCLSGKFECV